MFRLGIVYKQRAILKAARSTRVYNGGTVTLNSLKPARHADEIKYQNEKFTFDKCNSRYVYIENTNNIIIIVRVWTRKHR